MEPLRVDVWSDIACPWCWVGKRHLENALRAFDHRDAVELRWHAFELDPRAPKVFDTAIDYVERLARKYGTDREGAQNMIDRMTTTAAGDGLTMRFDHIKPGNTFDAHRLVHLALEHDRQDAMKERLFAAYLEEGRAISDRDTLIALGVDVGLDEARVKTVLEGDTFTDEVRADELVAQRLGISGVPFFIIDQRLGFSGAQPCELILSALNRAWDDRTSEDQAVYPEGAACGPDGC